MVFIAVILIIIGVLNVFARDLVWKLTALGNAREGVESRRTRAWDARRIGAGLALALLGIVILVREQPGAGPVAPYPGAAAYRLGSDPAVEEAIARQELSADELGGIDWYRVAAEITEAEIVGYYARETRAGACDSAEKPLIVCAGPDRTARFRTVALAGDEILLGVY